METNIELIMKEKLCNEKLFLNMKAKDSQANNLIGNQFISKKIEGKTKGIVERKKTEKR